LTLKKTFSQVLEDIKKREEVPQMLKYPPH
jgi:hypothetical protein